MAFRIAAFTAAMTILALSCGRAREPTTSIEPNVCSSARITNATVPFEETRLRSIDTAKHELDPSIRRAAEHAVVPEAAGRVIAPAPIGATAGPPAPPPSVLPAAAHGRVPVVRPGDTRPVLQPVQAVPGMSPQTPSSSTPDASFAPTLHHKGSPPLPMVNPNVERPAEHGRRIPAPSAQPTTSAPSALAPKN